MTELPKIWSVYYFFCTHTTPQKNKFIVITFYDVKPMGFLINSEIHPFIANKYHLRVCQVPLAQENHSFLNHDSYLDCQEVFPLTGLDQLDYRGEIHLDVRPLILAAVTKCPVLLVKHKEAIRLANTIP